MAERMREMLRERRKLLLRFSERRDEPGMEKIIREEEARVSEIGKRIKEAGGHGVRLDSGGHTRGH